jgi:hypothetical protein
MAKRHLFGGTKAGSSKTWHLSKYEVNGIDSTMYITPGNGYTSFENDEYTFFIDKYEKNHLKGKSKVYNSIIDWNLRHSMLESRHKEIHITMINIIGPFENQCNSSVCERNIFNPIFKNGSLYWKIVKLTTKEFIITVSDSNNNYKIILKH